MTPTDKSLVREMIRQALDADARDVTARIDSIDRRLVVLEKAASPPAPAPTPSPTLRDDPPLTWRIGPGATVRWGGRTWTILPSGQLAEAGRVTSLTVKTGGVVGVGITAAGDLQHESGGRLWRYSGTANWIDRGPSQPFVPAAPAAVPPASTPPASGGYVAIDPPAKARQVIRSASDAAVTVPRDFVGMHLHRWPDLPAYERAAGRRPTPTPTYRYGARRTWDYAEATAWCAIAGRSGTERNWSMLDEMIAAETSEGRSIMMTINGTPQALSSNPNGPGKYGGWPGSNYAPKDGAAFEALRRFVAELLARYGSKIAYWDGNNEPDPDNPIPAKDNFWIGSRAPQHAEWFRMQRLAIPRGRGMLIGPSQVFWSLRPGQVHDYALSVLTARDLVGTRLIDHLDGYGWHYYSDPNADPIDYWHAITAIRATLAAAGAPPDFPIFDTEHGKIDDRTADPNSFARRIQRDCAIAAGAGLRGIYLYSGDGPNLDNPSAGGPMGPAIDRVHADLPGLTIRQAAILADGTVWLRGMRDGKVAEVRY